MTYEKFRYITIPNFIESHFSFIINCTAAFDFSVSIFQNGKCAQFNSLDYTPSVLLFSIVHPEIIGEMMKRIFPGDCVWRKHLIKFKRKALINGRNQHGKGIHH